MGILDHAPLASWSGGAAIVDALPVGVAEFDAAWRVLRINNALATMFGVDPEAVLGRPLTSLDWRIVEPPDGELDRVLQLLFDQSGDPVGQRISLRHADGRWLRLRVWVRSAPGPGPGDGYLVTVTDLTEHGVGDVAPRTSPSCSWCGVVVPCAEDVALTLTGSVVTWASQAAQSRFRAGPGPLVGRALSAVLHPDDAARLRRLVSAQDAASHRLRLRIGGQERRWYQATLSGGEGDAEEPAPGQVCLRDIHDRIEEQEGLIERERRLRLALDASPMGLAICTVGREPGSQASHAVITFVNRPGAMLLGRSVEEIVGEQLVQVLPSTQVATTWQQLVAVLDSGVPARSRITHELGGRRLVLETFQARLDADSVAISWRDITHVLENEVLLSRAHEEAAEIRATLQSALDATSDGFAVYSLETDPSGWPVALRVVHSNAAGAASLGLDPAAMVGMDLRDFFPDAERSGLWGRIADAVRTKRPQYHRVHVFDVKGDWESSWDNTVAPVGEERLAITWRDVSKEESALRQLARTRDEAMYSATHDALTDLPNRVLLREHLHEALRSCLPGDRVGLVFVDLDKFKDVNDTYGHAAGDAVLKATAARLTRLIRHGDLAARLAGDEFVLVLTRLPQDWAPDQFFTRASTQLAAPVWVDGAELHPSASLGAVLADPGESVGDVDALIKEADAAMYRSKAARRASGLI